MPVLSPSAISTTTGNLAGLMDSVSVSVREALFQGRSRATGVQKDRRIQHLAADTARGRNRCIEQTVALLMDLATRGELDDAKEVLRRMEAGCDLAHERREGLGVRGARVLTFADIHVAEERAEGEAEEAEILAAHQPTTGNLARLLTASAKHRTLRARLETFIRRHVVAEDVR
jgi:predicted transcriptional regulator